MDNADDSHVTNENVATEGTISAFSEVEIDVSTHEYRIAVEQKDDRPAYYPMEISFDSTNIKRVTVIDKNVNKLRQRVCNNNLKCKEKYEN